MKLWRKVFSNVRFKRKKSSCHDDGTKIENNNLKKIGIVGSPNVGKSMVFNRLTGAYVIVSNYPGTTVSVSRGKAKIDGEELEIVDTPGMYSLLPITGEESVARSILIEEKPKVILQVVDAKNLERMLPFTLQLIEAGLPTILELNMMDETEEAGIEIDVNKLESELGIPVVATVATKARGMEDLKRRLVEYVRS